jgi:hypothetical protein
VKGLRPTKGPKAGYAQELLVLCGGSDGVYAFNSSPLSFTVHPIYEWPWFTELIGVIVLNLSP